MIDVAKMLDLLGREVTDKVTKLKGVVASVGFDLYGCVQALVNPGIDDSGKLQDSFWFDVSRLVVSETRVMEPPQFSLSKGPERKPTMH